MGLIRKNICLNVDSSNYEKVTEICNKYLLGDTYEMEEFLNEYGEFYLFNNYYNIEATSYKPVGLKIADFEEFFYNYLNEAIPKTYNFPNYFKGDLEGFPKRIVRKLVDIQCKFGNTADHTVFEKYIRAGETNGGFDWDDFIGDNFWTHVLINKDFARFDKKFGTNIETTIIEKINSFEPLDWDY